VLVLQTTQGRMQRSMLTNGTSPEMSANMVKVWLPTGLQLTLAL
jgi:hypothetical protein